MTKKHPTKDNAPRTIVKKDKIPTRMETVEIISKKTPGPGKYENDKKRKIYGNYLYTNTGGTFTDEALFRGISTPSHYN